MEEQLLQEQLLQERPLNQLCCKNTSRQQNVH
jgi:hypothetical protein